MASTRVPDLSYRLSVASRMVAAIGGGYAFTSLLMIAVSLLLPLVGINEAQSVFGATVASFLVYAGVIMAVFNARSATRAWIGLVIAALPPALIIVALIGRGPA